MKSKGVTIAAMGLLLSLGTASFAQQTNEQDRKDAERQTKEAKKASKAQAKADKSEHKALKSDKVKDAARDQDKADAAAARANQ